MVASVIEELSPKDERSKLLREKLAIIQEAQVSLVSAGFAGASNLQLLGRDALLKNFGFQPQVFSSVQTAPFEGSHVVGPEPKVLQNRVGTIRQADRMTGSSVTFTQKHREPKTSTKVTSSKTASRNSVFDRLGSPTSMTQRTVTQEPPFRAGAGRARQRPFQEARKKPGKASLSTVTRQRWRVPGGGSPGRLCPALAESAGQLPGHRHRRGRGGHCIPATTSAHPSKHQFLDQEQPSGSSACRRCLADEGSHSAGHQRDVPRIIQSVVPGAQEDRRSATCNRPVLSQPPHHSSTLQDGDARVRLISHQKSGVKAARCEATRLLRQLADQGRYSGTGSTACPDNHQGAPVSWLDHQLREVRSHTKSRLPVHRDAVQHSTFHSGAPTEDASKGPVSSSALDDRSKHHGQRFTQTSRHIGVHGFAGPARTAPSSFGPIVGGHSMVPEDRELVRPDSSSTVGSVRGGMVVISSSPARSTPRHQGDGSNSLHGCVQFGLGSAVTLTLDTGTVVSISTIVAHKRSGDAGRHLCCERLPTSSEVPGGSIDRRQRSDCGLYQERGETRSHTLMQLTIRLLKWCDVGSRPSARSEQYPGGFPVQSRPDTDHGVDDGHGESTTRVCQVGRATDRLVCDIRQQTTRQVRIAVSGPQGRVDRCHVHALGQREGPPVRIPAIQDGPSSTAEDRSVTRSEGDFDRSTATGSIVVPRVDESIPRRSDPAVRRRSRPADTRRLDGRRGDRDSSLPTVSTAGTWFPCKESATDTGPWMDHGARDCPLESKGAGENAMSR